MKLVCCSVVLSSLLLSGCGSEMFTGGPELRPGPVNEESLRRLPAHVLLLAREEQSVIELAKLGQRRKTGRTLRDYMVIQQRAHEEALDLLAQEYDLPYLPLSDRGAQIWSALQNHSHSAFDDAFAALEIPWQTDVIERLQRADIAGSAYHAAAVRAWGRDLRSLRVLSGLDSTND